MKKLIISLFLIASVCWADTKLNITFHNDTDEVVIVYMDSVDHNIMIDGKKYPFPIPVCGGELKPGKDFPLLPRKYNEPPYRYIVKWYIKGKMTYTLIKIPPKYGNALIKTKSYKLW